MHAQITPLPNAARPTEGEAPFSAGEVFFSRTDRRGVILSGNAVFRRVANYAWDELIGAPHKIIRHPDMPKGVFYILWERILKGQPVGAYVKNKSKDGLYYWVFAVVSPWQDGFVSSRIKPTSARLATVEKLYQSLLAREASGELTPEASAAEIEAAVTELGFDGYDDFAADSLSEELVSESKVTGGEPSSRIVVARKLLTLVKKLEQEASALLSAFDALTAVPRNLQIKSKMLEPVGGPLTALSSDYGRMSQEMSTRFMDHVIGRDDNFGKISGGIKKTLLYSGTREILRRCHAELIVENTSHEGFDLVKEQRLLEDIIEHYSVQAVHEANELDRVAGKLSKACKEMRRELLGLNTVRVTGKIENARLVGETSSLAEIITHLGTTQERVEEHLDAAKDAVDAIYRGLREINALERRHNTLGYTPRASPEFCRGLGS